jgi:transposase
MTDQIEVPSKRRIRASYTPDFRRQAVAECLVKGTSVAGVALRHGINANLLFGWRKDPRYNAGLTRKTDFLPVTLTVAGGAEPPEPQPSLSEIDIMLHCGARLICRGEVDEPSLVKVLRALRRTT